MIEYHFRVLSATVFTLYSYSKTLEYRLEYATAGGLTSLPAPSVPSLPVLSLKIKKIIGAQRKPAVKVHVTADLWLEPVMSVQ
jgi:hypothetical protein